MDVSVDIGEVFIVAFNKFETSNVCKVVELFTVVLSKFETCNVCKVVDWFSVIKVDVCKVVDRFSSINVDIEVSNCVGFDVDSCLYELWVHVLSTKNKTI